MLSTLAHHFSYLTGWLALRRVNMGAPRLVATSAHEHKLRYLHQNQGVETIELFRCRFLMQNETMIYGYARVSTAAQDESGQVRQL
jgi:hypothetical protein